MSGSSFTFNTAGNYGTPVVLNAAGDVVGSPFTPLPADEADLEDGQGETQDTPRAKVLERPGRPAPRTGGRRVQARAARTREN